MGVLTYPCMDLSQAMLVKGAPTGKVPLDYFTTCPRTLKPDIGTEMKYL